MSTKSASKHASSDPVRSTSPTMMLQSSDGDSKKKKKKNKKVRDDEVGPVDADVVLEPSDEKLITRIRDASHELYKRHGGIPTNAQIADEIGEEEKRVAKARKALANARKAHRVRAFRNAARKVGGGGGRDNPSHPELMGLDLMQSIFSESDIQRLARHNPLDYTKGSYPVEEAKMRMKLSSETLPKNAARKIQAVIEPMFRKQLTDIVHDVVVSGRQCVKPADVYHRLKQFRDHHLFQGVFPSDGSIRAAKEHGLEELEDVMVESEEDAKAWKQASSVNKSLQSQAEKMVKAEAERKELKRKSGQEEEKDEEEEEGNKKAKKKKK